MKVFERVCIQVIHRKSLSLFASFHLFSLFWLPPFFYSRYSLTPAIVLLLEKALLSIHLLKFLKTKKYLPKNAEPRYYGATLKSLSLEFLDRTFIKVLSEYIYTLLG